MSKSRTRRLRALDTALYNHRRVQLTLGYVSPIQFEQSWLAAQLRKAE
jgi:transposase InsO family protein